MENNEQSNSDTSAGKNKKVGRWVGVALMIFFAAQIVFAVARG
ncbi:hypothetical protein [Marinobacter litoralis]|nr:hypothetical protein [Marinobacter litoralis]